jgi:hypothetical protein
MPPTAVTVAGENAVLGGHWEVEVVYLMPLWSPVKRVRASTKAVSKGLYTLSGQISSYAPHASLLSGSDNTNGDREGVDGRGWVSKRDGCSGLGTKNPSILVPSVGSGVGIH